MNKLVRKYSSIVFVWYFIGAAGNSLGLVANQYGPFASKAQCQSIRAQLLEIFADNLLIKVSGCWSTAGATEPPPS